MYPCTKKTNHFLYTNNVSNRIQMSEEFVFRKPDETREEARDRLERGEDTRTLPSRDDDDDNGSSGGSSSSSRRRSRRREERKRRRRVEKELREADRRVEKEIQELTTSSGAIDISNLDRFRELSEKRTQIRNELRTDTPEPIILSEGETLQQGAKEAATRKAERLTDLTGKSVQVSRTVPQRQRGRVREQLLNLEKEGAISREQRQRTERELRNQLSQETITKGIRQFAERRARQNQTPGFRPAPETQPIFGGSIPFVTPFTEVFRNPLSSIDETPEERQQRITTQSDIPGLENVGRSVNEFFTGIRQRADTSLVQGENNVGLQLGRAAVDVAEGLGELSARPFEVLRGAGSTVSTAATQGLDEAIGPENEFLASRRLPFTVAAEAATIPASVAGTSLASRVIRSQRRLPKFLDAEDTVARQTFTARDQTPIIRDPTTGQTVLDRRVPERLDFRVDLEDGQPRASVAGDITVDEPRTNLVDPDTGRVIPLGKRGPLGSRLVSQRNDFLEARTTTDTRLDPGRATDELVGSQKGTPVDLEGDVRTVQELQRELVPDEQSIDGLRTSEEFVVQNRVTGRNRVVGGDEVVDLLDSGRFVLLDRKLTLREKRRVKEARLQQSRRKQPVLGLQTSLNAFGSKRGQFRIPVPQIQRPRRRGQGTRDVRGPTGTLRRATPDIDDVDAFTPRNGFGVRAPRLKPFGAGLALQEQNVLLEPFTTKTPSRTQVSTFTALDEEAEFTPVFDEETVQAQATSFDTIQDTRQKTFTPLDQPTRLDTRSITRPKKRSKKKRSRKPKKKGGAGLPTPGIDIDTGTSGGKPSRADVFVKRRGRFKKINQGWLTFDEAQDLGAKTVSETPSRTFKIERSTSRRRGEFKGDPDFFEENKDEFRKSKSDKFGLVEKTEFAIDSEGELEGITRKGIRSRLSSESFGNRRF